ncbi:hypothetical protein HMPREF0765_3731 [Sphingobacterium spiritivorum ATCC 33300]|uniref:Uncharacterized protein n=1 Tax=Sphingobacterium spiritivorum ATCC 33300 TaxID=525372 RepID=C2G2C5_SPHSI|nr:hypothetical protein [Sphingobacterium spiritivorum]EEI90672.1 hypothetical protein HMPREF0765_3731 [Sphingobacterium spiritivorum ATCC 33300]QQS95529.1 hypothetical protein I6J03_19470 [Sphingobacterium spiritivorum]
MKNLKWFWVVNYIMTIYSTILLSGYLLDIIFGYDKDGYDFTYKYGKYFMLANNEILFIFFFCIEWLQIPLVLGILIWKKQERTKWHWLYFIVLILLTIAKIIFYFIAVGGWVFYQP